MSRSLAGTGALAARPNPKKRRLEPEEVEELKEAFALFDIDSNGYIDAKELKAAFRAMGWNINKREAKRMIMSLDKPETGFISVTEFIELCRPRMNDRDSEEEVAKVFALFDPEGSGRITLAQLKRIITELGENIEEEEMRDMIKEADRDGKGYVTFEDFYRIQKRRPDPLDLLDEDDDIM